MGIDQSYKSSNFNQRVSEIDMILMHYTGMQSANEAFIRLCASQSQVSTHYAIDLDGRVYQFVDDYNRAWHAGISFWRGSQDINSRSIGIELVNKGHEFGYHSFPEAQINSLIFLCQKIQQKHSIKFVLGHSDVAPIRKLDPGELFPWEYLAQQGIGLWTNDFIPSPFSCTQMLSKIGYEATDEHASLTAFQRHFYPQALTLPSINDKTTQRLFAVQKMFDALS